MTEFVATELVSLASPQESVALYVWPLLVRVSSMICVLSVCLAVLRPLRVYLGARRAYLLWAALPLGLATLALPAGRTSAISVQISSVVAPFRAVSAPVMSRFQAATPQAQRLAWLQLWALGALTFLAVYVRLLVRWHRRMHKAPDSPAVVGILRTRMVLPADFEAQFTPEQQGLIRAHEQAHIAHRDPLWNLAFALLHAVLWFHPLMLWAHRAFRFDQELACDAAALAAQPSLRQTYAAALVQCNTPRPWQAVGCQWRNSHPLLERIRMLKYLTQSSSRTVRSGKLLLTASLLLLSAGLAYALQAGPVPATQAIANTASAKYWIAMALEHQGVPIGAPMVLVGEGEQAEVRVAQDAPATGAAPRHTQETPALRLTVVPTASENGLTQLRMQIFVGTPETLVSEPVLKVAGPGSVRFEDAATGTFTLNFAVRIADADSTKPPTDLIAQAPSYPGTAMAQRQQGDVMVRAKLNAAGQVTDAEVEWARPAGLFEVLSY
jgi:bla regulator protein blaR1